jgi:cytidylate kinase
MLLDMQRDVAKKYNVIMDGRDIGTVVLPKATVKIFLTASAEVRAKRRTDELLAKGQKANFQQTLKDIQQRDYQDMNRPIAPLKQAKDAVLLDTSELDIAGVIAAMKKIIGEKIPV